jgi:hypothetical protein
MAHSVPDCSATNAYSADSKLAFRIRRVRTDLAIIVDTDFGLVDKLWSEELLTYEQYEMVGLESKLNRGEKVGRLLDYVIQTSLEMQEQFLVALRSCQQSHVVNYILEVADGSSTDDWPVYNSKYGAAIRRVSPELKKLIHWRCGLLDELLEEKCINWQHKQYIENAGTDAQANDRLLQILLRSSIGVYKKFIELLVKTNQHKVASLLDVDGIVDSSPITDERRLRLEKNRPALLELIDLNSSGLIHEMRAAVCLTKKQTDFVGSAAAQSMTDGVTRVLEILERGSVSSYETFAECLCRTGQKHVALILLEEGIVKRIVAKFGEAQNVEETEEVIVERFRQLLSVCPPENRQQLNKQITEYLTQFQSQKCDLVAMKTHHSIALYFFCRSSSGLQFLHELYESDELLTIVNEMFKSLQQNCKTPPLQAAILEWDDDSSHQCV